MSAEAPILLNTKPTVHTSTNQLNETNLAPDFFAKSAAGASIGGAAWRTSDEKTAIPQLWPQLLPDTEQTFSNVTIEPYSDFLDTPQEEEFRQDHTDTEFILAHNPKPNEQGVLTYESMFDQLTGDQQFMEGVIAMLSNPKADAIINSSHFYITRRVLDAAKQEVPNKEKIIDIQRFHSLLSLTTRDLYAQRMGVSPEEANAYLGTIGITPERIMFEAQALASGYTIYSTAWERDNTVNSYDGFTLPDGRVLTQKELNDSSLVVPLSYSPEEYSTAGADQKKRKERKKWFPKFGIPLDAEFAMILGRKDPERGYVTAFEQAISYLSHTDNPMYFGFAGGVPTKSATMMATYNDVQKRYAEFAAEHPDRAQFIKWIDRVDHKHIAHAPDIEIQLPDTESWGLHVLQAMACGKPVIVSSLPTYQEWAQNGVIAVDQRDPQDFAAALDAMRDPSRAKAQGEYASKIAARYTHDRSMSTMLTQIMAKTDLVKKIQK